MPGVTNPSKNFFGFPEVFLYFFQRNATFVRDNILVQFQMCLFDSRVREILEESRNLANRGCFVQIHDVDGIQRDVLSKLQRLFAFVDEFCPLRMDG